MDVFIDLILSKLKQSFNNPEFSDVRIVSASATFYAHKLILTTRPGVWSEMEKFADIEVLCWNQIEDHVAERILRWIYMGERILCEKDSQSFAKSLVKAAQILKLPDVLEICESFFIFLDLKQESVPLKPPPPHEDGTVSITESKPFKRKAALPAQRHKSDHLVQRSKTIKRARMNHCGFCDNCRAEDCGRCLPCRDRPKFGGPGNLKKKCVMRACGNLAKARIIRETEAIFSKAKERLLKDRKVSL